MNQNSLFIVFIVCFNLIQFSYGHSYKFGSCPTIKPVPNFEIEKFLGTWYIPRKTATGSHCLVYNFNRTDDPNEFLVDQYSQHFVLGHTPVSHLYQYEGRMNILDQYNPALMAVRFPMNVAGNASYIVFYATESNSFGITDNSLSKNNRYEFAALHTCQKTAFLHRQSTTILSRTKEIDSDRLNQILDLMKKYGINPYDLSIIPQTNCPNYFNGTENNLVNIKIDDQTFTAKSAANVIRKVGYKLGDGIEFSGKITASLYDHLKGAYNFFRNYVL
ncbi:apolipoprotein D-like [Chrysoperla carnea]|uniref:apolipoprotein D-like n=1 Tax=Chrysoperla carnea TaxID=189513 RepID=UPI001D097CE9|nr:apolipoprotein D-like [Chrysoperla carnea]